MRCFENILAATDFSYCSASAVTVAASIARACDARLSVLHVVSSSAEARALTAENLAALAASVRGGCRIETFVRAGDASTEIVRHAEAEQADLVVTGTHGRNGLDRVILGSVAERVAQRAACSVLTVRAGSSRIVTEEWGSIVCALDLSVASEATLRAAAALARATGCRLTCLHVVDVEQPRLEEVAEPEYSSSHPSPHEQLGSLVAGIRPVTAIDTVVAFGRVRETVVQMAERCGASVLVLGAHGGSRIDRLILGSTTQQVLRSAPCPVLLARPPRVASREDLRFTSDVNDLVGVN